MLRHEYFQELCAAASAGQASPDELIELEQHARECVECRNYYSEYLQIAAQHYSAAGRVPELSLEQAKECINSSLFERRFFDLARREGIPFSAEVDRDIRNAPNAVRFVRRPQWRWIGGAIAAALFIGALLPSAYHLGKNAGLSTAAPQPKAELPDQRISALNQRIAELTTANAQMTTEIEVISKRLQSTSEELNGKDISLQKNAKEQQQLILDRDSLEEQLVVVQSKLADSQAQVLAAQLELSRFRNASEDATSSLVAAKIKINDLSAELKTKSDALDQEHQLLALGHDVSDMMGARNLHIVDVVDTDPHGRTRPAFGRVFFTEGKSLVFYAYDLNEARIEKAGYHYRVWAKQEGGDRKVRSLGIFYSDDKLQRRWVYKCDDPKILSEIDSVFVTLEPPSTDALHPKGPNLMYAYLRGQPNHP